MANAKPSKSCNDTVFKYLIAAKDLEVAKQQVIKVAGSHPVIFIEVPLADGQVELTVMSASLTPSQKDTLNELQQDGNMVKRIAAAEFEVNQVSFSMFNQS